MKKMLMTFAAFAVLCTAAFAQTEVSEEECDGSCPIAAALDVLPKMTYKVGEESTCCIASAQALAEDNDAEVHFVVAEKDYADQQEAMTALADETEAFVEKFTTPSTCSVSGTTSLAGHKMHCSTSAGKLADAMKVAMDEVQVAYKVGDESCHCPTKAKTLAEEKNEKMEYVVGDESTCCSTDARIKVAHAKFRAALGAFAEANGPSEETEEESAES